MESKCLILDDNDLNKVSWRNGTKNIGTLFKNSRSQFPFTQRTPEEKLNKEIFYYKKNGSTRTSTVSTIAGNDA
jgi:hypothetical protein